MESLCSAEPNHVGSDAWLHTLFPPLDSSDVNLLEEEIGRTFPESFREFLELTNGLNVFSDSWLFSGVALRMIVMPESANLTIFVSMNRYDRPTRLRDDVLLIALTPTAKAFCSTSIRRSERFYRCPSIGWRADQEMGELWEMLLAEDRCRAESLCRRSKSR